MTRILQLTDLHVFCEAETRLKGIPTRESLQDVVSHIHNTEQPFDHVIITGDHTHDETPAAYAAVRQILSPWIDRLWQVPGNHDDRRILRQTFSDRITGTAADRINFQFNPNDEWLCIGLDTHLPGSVSGLFDEDQCNWLTQQLSIASAHRIAVFFHHPPVLIGSHWMDAIGLNGREKLQKLVEDDDRIRLICCGHVHHDFQFHLGRASVFTTPSTGIQFNPEGLAANFVAEAPGYRIIELDGPNFKTTVKRLPIVKYWPEA